MVLSNRGGRPGVSGRGLGSTRPAAAEGNEADKCAEETRSDYDVYDIDQHLVDDWGRASDGSNDDREGLREVFRRREAFSSM